jgi:hypothetical protein
MLGIPSGKAVLLNGRCVITYPAVALYSAYMQKLINESFAGWIQGFWQNLSGIALRFFL